ncbi:helix-turn-helix domain-containing protein [Brevibacillus nitrificans]|uniref:helix-turn-helix domain-containing protein n=1 Tax=Brevibacillus nitrificans TaxID=651560 RepID=UPI00285DF2F1|nr:helix-turn-helix domain-containing protein [Brevibacillus nitrificans]MDR7316049.1 excisionase family DNA binding protein [Brevibacillus nitrificans]
MIIEDIIRRIVSEEISNAMTELKRELNSHSAPNKEYDETISPEQAAKVLGVSKQKVYDMARQKLIPCRKIGSRLIIPTKAFFNWLELKDN